MSTDRSRADLRFYDSARNLSLNAFEFRGKTRSNRGILRLEVIEFPSKRTEPRKASRSRDRAYFRVALSRRKSRSKTNDRSSPRCIGRPSNRAGLAAAAYVRARPRINSANGERNWRRAISRREDCHRGGRPCLRVSRSSPSPNRRGSQPRRNSYSTGAFARRRGANDIYRSGSAASGSRA